MVTSISTTAPNITAAIALRALPCKVSNSEERTMSAMGEKIVLDD